MYKVCSECDTQTLDSDEHIRFFYESHGVVAAESSLSCLIFVLSNHILVQKSPSSSSNSRFRQVCRPTCSTGTNPLVFKCGNPRKLSFFDILPHLTAVGLSLSSMIPSFSMTKGTYALLARTIRNQKRGCHGHARFQAPRHHAQQRQTPWLDSSICLVREDAIGRVTSPD